MRDIKHLAGDLRSWIERGLETGKREIAKGTLDAVAEIAPKDTGFLSSEVQVFIDGTFFQKSSEPANPDERQVSISPVGGYNASITLVSRAGRKDSRRVFDYGRFIGTETLKNANPIHLRWMSSALEPTIVKPLLGIGLRKEW